MPFLECFTYTMTVIHFNPLTLVLLHRLAQVSCEVSTSSA